MRVGRKLHCELFCELYWNSTNFEPGTGAADDDNNRGDVDVKLQLTRCEVDLISLLDQSEIVVKLM